MPLALSYPGVHIAEQASDPRAIGAVATSIAAFVGRTRRGPLGQAIAVGSYADFERRFGGLWNGAKLAHAVRDFYLNGGAHAIIVRLYAPDASAPHCRLTINGKTPFAAREAGQWGQNLRVEIDTEVQQQVALALGLADAGTLFNLRVTELRADGSVERSEQFRSVSTDPAALRAVNKVVNAESQLICWHGGPDPADEFALAAIGAASEALRARQQVLADALLAEPQQGAAIATAQHALARAQAALDGLTRDDLQLAERAVAACRVDWNEARHAATADTALVAAALARLDDAKRALEAATLSAHGSDGAALDAASFLREAEGRGLYALDGADQFNLLCIPPYDDKGVAPELLAAAASYCERRRALLLIDPAPSWTSAGAAIEGAAALGVSSPNAALYFPMLIASDPLHGGQRAGFAPCGAVAGLIASADSQRGVWKAPAGAGAALAGVAALALPLSDADIAALGQHGINCLRELPGAGRVVWGARTLQGGQAQDAHWKHIPARRTALLIEESIDRGTRWTAFEANDAALWAQIRRSAGDFMQKLFRQGAFAARTAQDAYFVKCGAETTSEHDIARGVVNIVVGFAPFKPAEFIVIALSRCAGQRKGA